MNTYPNSFATTLSKLDKNLRILHRVKQDISTVIAFANPMCINVDNLLNVISTSKLYDYYAKLPTTDNPDINLTTDKLENLEVYFKTLKNQLIRSLNDLLLIDDIESISEDELYEEVEILSNGKWWGYNKLPLTVAKALCYNAMVKFINTSSARTEVNFDTHLFRQIFADCIPYTFYSTSTVHRLEIKYADAQKKLLSICSQLNNDSKLDKDLTLYDDIVYNLGVVCLYWVVNKLVHDNRYGLKDISNLFIDYYKDMDASMLGKELTKLTNMRSKYIYCIMLLDLIKFERSMDLSYRKTDDGLIDNALDNADNCLSTPREYGRKLYDYMSSVLDIEI